MSGDSALLSALQPQRIWDRCDALGRLSELPGGLTRVFLSAEQRQTSDLVLATAPAATRVVVPGSLA